MNVALEMAENVRDRILIVEDELDLIAPLEYSLKKAGYDPVAATDGLTACRLVGEEQIDLILLDVQLPDLDGWEICQLIRRHPTPDVAKIPIIMLTALSSQEDREKGLRLGANAYQPKPYSISDILQIAKELLKKRPCQ